MTKNKTQKGLSLMICIGSYGGFYFLKRPESIRLCLGWIAFTLLFYDLEKRLTEIL